MTKAEQAEQKQAEDVNAPYFVETVKGQLNEWQKMQDRIKSAKRNGYQD